MDGVWIAVIVAAGSLLSPLLLSHLTARQRRLEKEQDWGRQDAVAERLLKATEQTADRLLAANERVAASTRKTNVKLDVIHTLVDGTMTAAMRSEYEATKRELAMMREVLALNQAAGRQPSASGLKAIEETAAKVVELRGRLEERLQQAAEAAALQADTGDAPPAG